MKRTTLHTVGIIPARLNSRRFPGKLLASRTGKPLIQHTWERALQSPLLDAIYVATDSEEIAEAVGRFGGKVLLTTGRHLNGTSRVAEAARELGERLLPKSIVVNIQGDQPEIAARDIDLLVRTLNKRETFEIATLAAPLPEELQDARSAVKLTVRGDTGEAAEFSRYPLVGGRLHVGVYAFRWRTLRMLATAGGADLEQVGWMEGGNRLLVVDTDCATKGIDTPSDYKAFVRRVSSRMRRSTIYA